MKRSMFQLAVTGITVIVAVAPSMGQLQSSSGSQLFKRDILKGGTVRVSSKSNSDRKMELGLPQTMTEGTQPARKKHVEKSTDNFFKTKCMLKDGWTKPKWREIGKVSFYGAQRHTTSNDIEMGYVLFGDRVSLTGVWTPKKAPKAFDGLIGGLPGSIKNLK